MTRSNNKGKRASRTAESAGNETPLASASSDAGYEEDHQYDSVHPEFRMEYRAATQELRMQWMQSLSAKVKKSEMNVLHKVDMGEFHDFMLAQEILSPGPLKRGSVAAPRVASSSLEQTTSSRKLETVAPTSAGSVGVFQGQDKGKETSTAEDELYMFSFGGPGPSNQWDSVIITEHSLIHKYLSEHPGHDLYLNLAPRRIPFELRKFDNKAQGVVATVDLAAGTRIFWERPLLVATQAVKYSVFLNIDQTFQREAGQIRRKVVDLLDGKQPLSTGIQNHTLAVLETRSFDVRFHPDPSEAKPMRAVFERISRCGRVPTGGNVRFNFDATFCGELWATRNIAAGDEVIISQ
ncbi:hypothetical protein CALCODRAFT_233884 [Calocera cornea HHB12733]|uniref:Uncharacterized protein n=1 Tax=Calocera cornea HHB12733 TaxID=1353952 RepID=A0A165GWZ8_9BASI|nr:hypothetical protein CALCODRAFT_233884 [Calocera cornea HHB12733]